MFSDKVFTIVNKQGDVISSITMKNHTDNYIANGFVSSFGLTLEESKGIEYIFYLTIGLTKKSYRNKGYSKQLLHTILEHVPKNSLIYSLTEFPFIGDSLLKIGFKEYYMGISRFKTYYFIKKDERSI